MIVDSLKPTLKLYVMHVMNDVLKHENETINIIYLEKVF